ncbi:signal peptidase [Burkholderia sp. WAC0059]|uniref:signal peptidase n=1 Tax=Burkholderia sp. WAC0059 TaxID=2066022 RepID=UPI000C7EC013|nr:signal peptidase [Burkholderia sp. WAC0059]PLZ04299.1 signal peptidase [Burkholderia sp. WAC0059]
MRTRNAFMLAATTLAVFALGGCATQVRSLPLAPVTGSDAGTQDVALYFGDEAHPPVTHEIGRVETPARIARQTEGAEVACREAIGQALESLRADARRRGGNAVVGIETHFHSTKTTSSSEYLCGVSPSAAALRISGEVVVLGQGSN